MRQLTFTLLCVLSLRAFSQNPGDNGLDHNRTVNGSAIFQKNNITNSALDPFQKRDKLYGGHEGYVTGLKLETLTMPPLPTFYAQQQIKKVSLYLLFVPNHFFRDKDSVLAATFEFDRTGDMVYSENKENEPFSIIKKRFIYNKPHQLQTIKTTTNNTYTTTSDNYKYYEDDKEVYVSRHVNVNADSFFVQSVTKTVYDSLNHAIAFYEQRSAKNNELYASKKYYYDAETNRLTQTEFYKPGDSLVSTESYVYAAAQHKKTTYIQVDTLPYRAIKQEFFDTQGNCIKTIEAGPKIKTTLNTYNPDGTLFQQEIYYNDALFNKIRYYYQKF